jgi:hypothetical protein
VSEAIDEDLCKVNEVREPNSRDCVSTANSTHLPSNGNRGDGKVEIR